jgi:uncharacterized protein YdaT
MPWNPDRYPPSMQHLSELQRRKAIEIANALLAEGLDEGKAIRIGIAKGRDWVRRHGGDAMPQWSHWSRHPGQDGEND